MNLSTSDQKSHANGAAAHLSTNGASANGPAAPIVQSMGRKTARGSRFQHGNKSVHGEDSAAYKVLLEAGLLDTSYRLESSAQIDAIPENATRGGNCLINALCCPCVCTGIFKTFEVDAANVRLGTDGRGSFNFYAPGVHRVLDPFVKVNHSVQYKKGVVSHGDLTLAVVEQGTVGLAYDQGQPILLPPGLHQWRSPTMAFERAFDLNNNVIRLGPLTIVTVDAGYSAVSEDNGSQRILAGGNTYLLTHRNWKFEKFIPQKIQSSNLKRIEATSADNVLMAVDATVIWRITDVETAALNSAETISKSGKEQDGSDLGSLTKLTNDVLKQAEASLAAFIGAVEYSSTFAVAASTSNPVAPVVGEPIDEDAAAAPAPAATGPTPKAKLASPLFDLARMQTCVNHANAVTKTYGVSIISINVVSAVPADKTLMVALAQGAVAAAEAQKFETVAAGKAAAAKIEARGAAEAEVLRAQGDADAERMRADGHKRSADLLAQNDIAVRLAEIDRTGKALGSNKAFFFGGQPSDVSSLFAGAVASSLVPSTASK